MLLAHAAGRRQHPAPTSRHTLIVPDPTNPIPLTTNGEVDAGSIPSESKQQQGAVLKRHEYKMVRICCQPTFRILPLLGLIVQLVLLLCKRGLLCKAPAGRGLG